MPVPNNTNMRAVGSNAARSKGVKYIRSFHIRKSTDATVWYLYVNQKTLLGLYPTQEYAIDALYGAFTSVNANNAFTSSVIDAQLLSGVSEIEPAFNVLTLTQAASDITVDLSAYDPSTTAGYSFVYFGWEKLVDGVPQGITISEVTQLRAASGASDQSATFTGAWSGLGDGEGARPVLVGFDGTDFTVVAYGRGRSNPPAAPIISFTVDVSGTDGLPATGVEMNDNAYAVITESSVDGTPSYTYEWFQTVPTLTGITLTNQGP